MENTNTEIQEQNQTSWHHWSLLFSVSLALILTDQVSKALIVANLDLYESWIPLQIFEAFFEITYTRNTGAAFGLFTSAGDLFLLIALIAGVVIIYFYRDIKGNAWLLRIAMGLQLGGAIGNAIDRITRGYVVDFLHVFYEPVGFDWPVFNIADSAIVIGVSLLVLLIGFEEKD